MAKAWEPYIDHLAAIPFVESIVVKHRGREAEKTGVDAVLDLRTPTKTHRIYFEAKTTNLSLALAGQMVGLGARLKPLLVGAPVIGSGAADLLVANEVNFVDLRGNHYLNLGGRYIASAQGKRGKPAAHPGVPRLPSYFVLFTLIAEPALLSAATVRQLAGRAGVSRQPAVWMREQLVKLGIAVRGPKRCVWAAQGVKRALDLWLAGYVTAVRPKLIHATYRTRDDTPFALELRLPLLFDRSSDWRWGGGAAAHRLTKHFRGERTVVHVEEEPANFRKRLGGVPDDDGRLIVMAAPGPTGMLGATKDTAHPLLVYSELLADGSERAREAAEILAERFGIGKTP